MTTLLAEWTLVDGVFQPDYQVSFEDGVLTEVGPAGRDGLRLPRRALLPGLVNVHSHAFQRAIRGRTEYRDPTRAHDDFWSWRERMYGAAMRLSPEALGIVSQLAFVEMLLSGITSVGEFHYLQHQSDGRPYPDPDELAGAVAGAAEAVGLRLVMLRVGYARAGFEIAPNPRQARFIDPSPEAYLEAVERLRSRGLKVGIAPHSVRACPRDWLEALGDYARRHSLPFHMHVAEQPREIEECLREHKERPLRFLADLGLVDERFVGVHAIHLDSSEIEILGRAQATVCSCPTTERNLGDGIVSARELLAAGAHLALGTDSQCQIDLWEDARQLEYHLRLQKLERALLDPLQGPGGCGRRLLEIASLHGARALGLAAGALEAGRLADMVCLDLDDPALAGSSRADAPDMVAFAAHRGAVREVWVGGRQMVRDGRHPLQSELVREFSRAMEDVRGQE